MPKDQPPHVMDAFYTPIEPSLKSHKELEHQNGNDHKNQDISQTPGPDRLLHKTAVLLVILRPLLERADILRGNAAPPL